MKISKKAGLIFEKSFEKVISIDISLKKRFQFVKRFLVRTKSNNPKEQKS